MDLCFLSSFYIRFIDCLHILLTVGGCWLVGGIYRDY